MLLNISCDRFYAQKWSNKKEKKLYKKMKIEWSDTRKKGEAGVSEWMRWAYITNEKSDAVVHIFTFIQSIHTHAHTNTFIPKKRWMKEGKISLLCRQVSRSGKSVFRQHALLIPRMNMQKKNEKIIIINMSSYLPTFYLPLNTYIHTFPDACWYRSAFFSTFLSLILLITLTPACCLLCQTTMKS